MTGEIKVITSGEYRKYKEKNIAKSNEICEKLKKAASYGYLTLREFLNSKNSMKIKNKNESDVDIFKFRADGGDRVIYTWFKDPFPSSDSSKLSIVLLDYVPHEAHEEQIKIATSRNWTKDDDWQLEHSSESEAYEVAEVNAANDRLTNYSQKNWFYEPSNYLSQDMDEYYQPVMIKEQTDVLQSLKNGNPLYIGGGAGSGKTILGINVIFGYQEAIKFSEEKVSVENKEGSGDIKCVYFTFSPILKDDAYEQYKSICKNRNIPGISNIEFYDILSYLSEKTDILRNRIVTFEIFESYFFYDYLKTKDPKIFDNLESNNINSYNVWTQIRGILKGYMGDDWHKSVWLQRNEFGNLYSALESLDLIYEGDLYCRKNEKTFRLKRMISDSIKEKICKYIEHENSSLKSYEKKNISSIIEQIQDINLKSKKFDYNNIDLSCSDYLKISQEISFYNFDQKKMIYEVFSIYLEWLRESEYKDENDITAKIISGIEDDREKYSFIVVDEVQDLTEVQIFMIIQLLENNGIIVFTGDIHQTINPTFFSISRLRDYFYASSLSSTQTEKENTCKLEQAYLSYNFRSQKEIIELANRLSKIRQRKVSKFQIETEIEQKALKDNGIKPFLLNYKKESRNELLLKMQIPYAAVVVSNERKKNKLLEELKFDGIDVNEIINIYTINDIKGMEYKYVLCYNLVADYEKEWRGIIEQKGEEVYRYYFNVLYVAVTRSTDYLYLMDDIKEKELKKWYNTLSDNQMSILNFDELYLNDLDAGILEDWFRTALEHEKNGQDNIHNLEKAIEFYKKSQHKNNIFYIKRCETQKLILRRKFKEAFGLALSIKDIKKAKECALSIKDGHDYVRLINFIDKYKNNPFVRETEDLQFFKKNGHLHLSTDTYIRILDLILDDTYLNNVEKYINNIRNNFNIYIGDDKDG